MVFCNMHSRSSCGLSALLFVIIASSTGTICHSMLLPGSSANIPPSCISHATLLKENANSLSHQPANIVQELNKNQQLSLYSGCHYSTNAPLRGRLFHEKPQIDGSWRSSKRENEEYTLAILPNTICSAVKTSGESFCQSCTYKRCEDTIDDGADTVFFAKRSEKYKTPARRQQETPWKSSDQKKPKPRSPSETSTSWKSKGIGSSSGHNPVSDQNQSIDSKKKPSDYNADKTNHISGTVSRWKSRALTQVIDKNKAVLHTNSPGPLGLAGQIYTIDDRDGYTQHSLHRPSTSSLQRRKTTNGKISSHDSTYAEILNGHYDATVKSRFNALSGASTFHRSSNDKVLPLGHTRSPSGVGTIGEARKQSRGGNALPPPTSSSLPPLRKVSSSTANKTPSESERFAYRLKHNGGEYAYLRESISKGRRLEDGQLI